MCLAVTDSETCAVDTHINVELGISIDSFRLLPRCYFDMAL